MKKYNGSVSLMILLVFILISFLIWQLSFELPPKSDSAGPSSSVNLAPFWAKANLHTHTKRSDGFHTLEEVISHYKNNLGYNVLAITDHNHVTSCQEMHSNSSDRFLCIDGEEWSPIEGHMVRLYVNSTFYSLLSRTQKMINSTVSQGGIVIIAHPAFSSIWSVEGMKSYSDYLGIEIYNRKAEVIKRRPYSVDRWDALLRSGKKVWGFAVDDMHQLASDAGSGWIEVYVETLTHENFSNSLTIGNFYSTQGPTMQDQPFEITCNVHPLTNLCDGTTHYMGAEANCTSTTVKATIKATNQGEAIKSILLIQDGKILEEKRDCPPQQSCSFTYASPIDTNSYYRIEANDTEGKQIWSNPIWINKKIIPEDNKSSKSGLIRSIIPLPDLFLNTWFSPFNTPPILEPIPQIIVNESDLVMISPKATDAYRDKLSFFYFPPLNSSGHWQTNFSSAGTYNVTFTVEDRNCGIDVEHVTVIVNNDLDHDGIPDYTDEDSDNDGIMDEIDPLLGDLNDVRSDFESLQLRIEGQPNLSQPFIGTREVTFLEGTTPRVSFIHNFSIPLNLGDISIIKPKSKTMGSILVSGIPLSEDETKTVYFDHLDSFINSVCVKDAEIHTLKEISRTCLGENETLVHCDGKSYDGYVCISSPSTYQVIGLKHSGVREQAPCRESWRCDEWDPCFDEIETRTCIDFNNCGTNITKPGSRECSLYQSDFRKGSVRRSDVRERSTEDISLPLIKPVSPPINYQKNSLWDILFNIILVLIPLLIFILILKRGLRSRKKLF